MNKPQSCLKVVNIVLNAVSKKSLKHHEGPLGSPIPQLSSTMVKTVFRKFSEALIFSVISGP